MGVDFIEGEQTFLINGDLGSFSHNPTTTRSFVVFISFCVSMEDISHEPLSNTSIIVFVSCFFPFISGLLEIKTITSLVKEGNVRDEM